MNLDFESKEVGEHKETEVLQKGITLCTDCGTFAPEEELKKKKCPKRRRPAGWC